MSLHQSKNVFKQIFIDHWADFKEMNPGYRDEYYDNVIKKMLGCADPKNGFAAYRCLKCRELKKVSFSCKSSFCLSCAKVYTDDWVDYISGALFPGMRYRHVVPTVPERFRKWFYHNPDLLDAHYFQNWGHAVASCGINYEKIRRQRVWSREKIIKELKKYKAEGAELSYNAFEKQDSKLFHAAQYQFGSWKRALSFIDVDYKKIRKWPGRTWSKKKITSKIKALKKKGVDLSLRAMFKQGYGTVVSMAAFYFGSWRRAIEQAGLDYNKIKKMPGPAKGYKRKN